MAADPDALWKPGDSADRNEWPAVAQASDVSVDLSGAEAPDQAVEPEPPSPWSVESDARFVETPRLAPKKVADQPGGQRNRLPRAWLAVGLAMVLAIAAFIVVARDSSDVVVEDAQVQDGEPVTLAEPVEVVEAEPLVDEPFAGSDPRRLPSELVERWTANIDGVAATTRSRLFVGGNNTVVGAFDAVGPSGTVTSFEPGEELGVEVPAVEQLGSVVVALDAETGDERWRTPSDSEVRALSVLGIFDGVVVLERLDIDNRAVTGLDELTGELLWERRTADPGVHVALEGTSLITRVSFTANERLTFIDPATGDEVGRVPGRLFATDFLGTWFVRNENSVTMLDLADGWSLPTKFGTLDVDDSDPATVIDGRIIEVDNGEARAASAFVTGPSEVDFSVESSVGVTTPTSILRLSPMVGSAFVLTGSGAVFGADLGGDVIDVRWRAEGAVIDTVATDRGLSILIGRDGGASQQIVDGSTGELISVVQLLPGSMDTLEMVGNGVLMKRDATIGSERVGLDLDGNRMWSLVGNGPIAVGDEVIVTFGPSGEGVGITAYGDV